MSARLVRVPDGKREHIGVLIDHDWQPICGQVSSAGWFWLPVSAGLELRASTGTCQDCLTAAGAISDLAEACQR